MPNNAPRRLVEFSRSALDSNLSELSALSTGTVIDVRCDAYGHGADWVTRAAHEHGFSAFLTDDNEREPIPESAHHLYGTTSGVRVGVVTSELVTVKDIPAGDSVSYGYTWTAPADTRLGLVSLGFADGLPRAGSNLGTMTLCGQAVPVVGRIAMDQCVVNLTDIDGNVGAKVAVWDSLESVRTWAVAANRNPLSLMTGLSWRVERSWIA